MSLPRPDPAADPGRSPSDPADLAAQLTAWRAQALRLAGRLQEARAAYARLAAQQFATQAELVQWRTGPAGRLAQALQQLREGLAPDGSLRHRLLALALPTLLGTSPAAAGADAGGAAPDAAWEAVAQRTRAALTPPAPARSWAADEAPLVSVIVLNLNGRSVLGRCLDRLLAQRYPNFEIIVVDNASSDGSLALLEPHLATGRLTVVRSPYNRGCPGGRNLGLEYARGEVVAFIDNDGYAHPDWLAETVRVLLDRPEVGAVAPLVFFEKNKLVLNGAGATVNWQGYGGDVAFYEPYEFARLPEEVLYPMGCGMVLRRAALDKIAPLDDALLNYFDDTEVGFRLWAAGFRVAVARRAWVDHDFNYSSRFLPGRASLIQRGRIRTVLKYFPIRHLARFAWREAGHVIRNWPLWPIFVGAWLWNAAHLASALRQRRRFGAGFKDLERLLSPTWGWFPPAAPTHTLYRPRLAALGPLVHVGDEAQDHLVFGWYWAEARRGVFFRWTAAQASVFVRLRTACELLWLVLQPAAVQTLSVRVRRLGEVDPVWETVLADLRPGPDWQFLSLDCPLPAGDYEVLLLAHATALRQGRTVGVAVHRIEFR